MQRLVKCCLRAAFSSAVLELPAKGSRAPRAACEYGALVRLFTARRYSAAARDALRTRINSLYLIDPWKHLFHRPMLGEGKICYMTLLYFGVC
jgi:hypothetical protein